MTQSKTFCCCKSGDFGNDGNCNECGGGIVCNVCGRLPCECMTGEEWLSTMHFYENKPSKVS